MTNRVRSLVACLVLLAAVFAGTDCFAQSEAATLSGRVVDPSDAAVPEAKVDLTDTDRNFTRTTYTNQEGLYTFPNLRPGRYRISISKQGFKTVTKVDLILHVQDSIAQNFSLPLGSVTESITVSGGAPLVNTESATVSTVVDRQFAENLPLNGRSFQTLIATTPGVVLTAAGGAERGQFSVNGQRADANYFTVDGVGANFGVGPGGSGGLGQTAGGALPGFSVNGGTNTLISVDAMQEFRVQTSSFAPEFGRSPGGQISIATRSGANDFHGTVFDYFRNDVFDAKDWFANRDGLPKPKDRQNDFGGVFAGPVAKDKTFFFFSYEGLRLRQPNTALTNVPALSARRDAPPQVQPFLNAFPVPNGPEFLDATGTPTGLAPFNSSYSDPSTLDAYSIRVDHSISSKLNLFGRYNYAPSAAEQRNSFALNSISVAQVDTQTMTVGLSWASSPRVSNELRMNYSNARNTSSIRLDSIGGATPPSDSVLFPSGFSSENGLFQMNIGFAPKSPTFGVGKIGTAEQRQVNLIDNLSVLLGGHQLKFGVDYRWLAPFDSPGAYRQFLFSFGIASAISGIAEFALVEAQQSNALLARNFSFYGQDSWRITPRLTLTYGLRWDFNPPLKGKDPASEPFTVRGLNDPATMTLAPRGTPLYQTTYGNVAPRLGVAYQLNSRQHREMVLRGGFGLFYDLGSGSLGNVTGGFPYRADNFFNFSPVSFPLTPQQAAPPPFSLTPPVSQLFLSDPGLKLPRTYQWNVAIEQSLSASQSFSISYVGALGRDLLRQNLLFFPNADFATVGITRNAGTSDYHALQVQYQRRLYHDLQALAAYTFSHSIDNASNDSSGLNTPAAISPASVDRGNSDFDVRHKFTALVTYDLPRPRQGKAMRAVLADWSLDSSVIVQSASPVSGIIGAVFFVGSDFLVARPDVVPGQPFYLYGSQYPGGKAINNTPGAVGSCPDGSQSIGPFCPPAQGQQGNLGRNVLRGFGMWQADLALRRQFHLTARWGLQFRAEFFNIFNHPNFGNPNSPNTTIGQPLFGQSTKTFAQSLGTGGGLGGGLNPLYQVGGPRSIQFALKLQF